MVCNSFPFFKKVHIRTVIVRICTFYSDFIDTAGFAFAAFKVW